MKRLITLLFLALAAFTFKASAQTGTACNAAFSFTITAGNTVHFIPAMIGDSNATLQSHHSWFFGDNTPSSSLVDPTHVYPNCNTSYTVKHYFWKTTPNGVICSDTVTQVIFIQCPTTPTCNAAFTQTISGQNVHFIPAMPGDSGLTATTHHNWLFGDGQSSTAIDPTHFYANCNTTYTVRHIFWRTGTNSTALLCSDTVYHTVYVACPVTCNIQANFTWHPDSLQSNKIWFTNTTLNLAATDSVRWNFGDGSVSYDMNPNHIYTQPGTYNVCLRIQRIIPGSTAPCVSEICKLVTVTVPCNLQAYFTWHADSLQFNKIYFQNQTVNFLSSDSIRWTFGDGTVSYDVNPTHIYAAAGTYTVCLRVKRNFNTAGTAPCVSEICKTVVVQAPTSCNLHANFTWAPDPLHPTKIHFTNTSTPVDPTDSTRWTFGDGTVSYDFNPVHTYTTPGTYTVCLREKKNFTTPGATPCVSEICKTIVVTEPCTLTVDFSWHPDSLQSNKIWFTNLSTPLSSTDSIKWTFGDGSSATSVNADHVYTQGGTYTVCLRVKKANNAIGTVACVREICKTITVVMPCSFTPSFTWALDSVNKKKVYFTNTTLVPTATSSATWSFGDGTTAAGWNAVHEYAQPGRYYVCLRIESGPNCVKYKCDSILVPAPEPPCSDLAKFTYQQSTADYLKFKFIPTYQNSSYLYIWSFGDGTGSNTMIAEHRYAQPGVYNACLTVFRNNTCVSTVCKEIRINPQIICDSIHVSYVYQHDPYIVNKYYFYAVSNFPLLQQRWTFKRISPTPAPLPVVLYQNNPVYVFPDTGWYNVCLRAITLGGCVKEYCSNIHITQVSNTTACQLQAYPNPANSIVNVNVQLSAPEMIHAYVYNSLNILVKEKHQQGVTGNNVVSIEVGSLVPGWYTIKLIYGNKTCYARFQKI